MNATVPVADGGGSVLARLIRFLTSRYLLAVGAQAMVSAFHFVLNLSLLRVVAPHDYGIFAFAFVLAIVASAINNALVATPLTVYTPVIEEPLARRRMEGMFATANLALLVAFVAGGGLWALAGGHADLTGLGVIAFVVAFAARQYSRNVGYARMRPLVVAAGDIVYAVGGTVLLGAVWLWKPHLPVSHVLLAAALANALAMAAERVLLNRSDPTARDRVFGALAGYGRIWRESAAWALAGALTTVFLTQAHSFIVTTSHGPGAFAPLAAGFVLFGPVRMALLTWQNMVKPELAVALHAGRVGAVRARIRTTVWRMAAAVGALGVLLAVGWPWVHEFLYARRYADQPMALIVALWCLVTLVGSTYNAPGAALQALTDFRVLAVASIWAALVAGTLVTLALVLHSPEATLLGLLAAEIFMALWVARALARSLAAREGAPVAAPVTAAVGPAGVTRPAPATPLDGTPDA